VARVTIFDTPRGKKKFKNLKYPEADVKRKAGEPVVFKTSNPDRFSKLVGIANTSVRFFIQLFSR
jgi:hypothetical protein